MIRHVVAWKLASEDEQERAEHARRIVAALESLPPLIPEVLDLTAGRNSLAIEGNWDVVLVADFADAQALDRYQVHPEHKRVGAYIRSVVADRVAVDITVTD